MLGNATKYMSLYRLLADRVLWHSGHRRLCVGMYFLAVTQDLECTIGLAETMVVDVQGLRRLVGHG
jgi:hypothetical protein